MTQKVLEIDVMVYNMTKNPKTYKKIFLVTVLKINNGRNENLQISKITNAEKHRNVRKWRAIEFFLKYQGTSLVFLNINRRKFKT